MTGLTDTERAALQDLQDRIGLANAAKGFHEAGDDLRTITSGTTRYEGKGPTAADRALRAYYSERLLQIVTAIASGQSALDRGYSANEMYYPTKPYSNEWGQYENAYSDPPYRPEGVPAALAVVVIRCLDLAVEADFDLAAAIDERLRYEETL